MSCNIDDNICCFFVLILWYIVSATSMYEAGIAWSHTVNEVQQHVNANVCCTWKCKKMQNYPFSGCRLVLAFSSFWTSANASASTDVGKTWLVTYLEKCFKCTLYAFAISVNISCICACICLALNSKPSIISTSRIYHATKSIGSPPWLSI